MVKAFNFVQSGLLLCLASFLCCRTVYATESGLENRTETPSSKLLHFMLLLSQGGRLQDWSQFIPAVDLALKKINADESILPGYQLIYGANEDTSCDPNIAVQKFINQFISCGSSNTKNLFVIGDICSVVTQELAAITSLWNVFHISPYSASPRLSDTSTYETFVRLVPPENEIAPGIVALMKAFNWKHLAIITEEHELFTLTREAIFDSIAGAPDLSVIHSSSYPQNNSPERAVNALLASSGRIVFLNSYSGHGKEVMCQVYRKAKSRIHEYAWLIFGWYPDKVWEQPFVQNRAYGAYNDCTPNELRGMFNRAIIVSRYPRLNSSSEAPIVGNTTHKQYFKDYYEQCNETFSASKDHHRLKSICSEPSQSGQVSANFLDATHGYDTIWLAARALHAALDATGTQGSDALAQNLTSELLSHSVADSFQGASGWVQFHANGDRVIQLSYYQYVPSSNDPDYLVRNFIGSYHNSTIGINSFDDVFPDYKPVSHGQQTIHLALFVCYCILAIGGIIFAVACLIFTVVFRNKMVVRLTSPPLSAVSVVGIILLLFLVIFLGIGRSITTLPAHNVFCVLNLWMGMIAFTLVFGAVLAKAFRVYYIFKNIKVSKDKQTKTVQDWHMFLLIGVLVGIDVVFLTVVTAVEQSRLRVQVKETIPTDGSLPQIYYECVSATNGIWLPVLAVYKIGEVVLSMIFTFEVRKIRVKGLVESRMITFSVYTMVVCVLVIPVVVFLPSAPNVRYGILGCLILLVSIILLCLNFVPKMYSLCKNPSGEVDLNLATVTESMVAKNRSARSEVAETSAI